MTDTDRWFIPREHVDEARIFAPWGWLLRKPYTLDGASLFGDLFLTRSDGSIEMLDLVEGALKEVATCIEEFQYILDTAEGKAQLLMVPLAVEAARAGLRPENGQCLAFRIPPMLNGELRATNLDVWDIYAYHEGLAKLLPQILGLPLGTQVAIKAESKGSSA